MWEKTRPCQSSGGQLTVSHSGGQGSIARKVMRYLWWTTWHCGRVSQSTSVSPAHSHSTNASAYSDWRCRRAQSHWLNETVRYGIQKNIFFLPFRQISFDKTYRFPWSMGHVPISELSFIPDKVGKVRLKRKSEFCSAGQGRNGPYYKSGQRHLAYSPFQVRSKSVTTSEKCYQRTEIQTNMRQLRETACKECYLYPGL